MTISFRIAWLLLLVGLACNKGETEGNDSKAPTPSDSPEPRQVVKNEPAAAAPTPTSDETAPGDLGVDSAKIVFRVTGPEDGTLTVWLSGHGNTIVAYREMNRPVEEKRHTVWRNGETTTWKEGEAPAKTAGQTKDTQLRLVAATNASELESQGYEKKPNAQIAGVECEVWYRAESNTTLWRWNGIDLKYLDGAAKPNPHIIEAIEVVTPSEIPADMIGPPSM